MAGAKEVEVGEIDAIACSAISANAAANALTLSPRPPIRSAATAAGTSSWSATLSTRSRSPTGCCRGWRRSPPAARRSFSAIPAAAISQRTASSFWRATRCRSRARWRIWRSRRRTSGGSASLAHYSGRRLCLPRPTPFTKDPAMHDIDGLSLPVTLAEIADPRRTALVVYDMQVGILRQLRTEQKSCSRCCRLIEAARRAGVPVFFMRHMSLPRKLAGVFQLRQAMAWQRVSSPAEVKPWFLRDSPGFQLAPELGVAEDEAIFDKIGMSAFEGTPLAMALRDLGRQSFLDLRHRHRDRHRADSAPRRGPGSHPDRRSRRLRRRPCGSRRARLCAVRIHRRRDPHQHCRGDRDLDQSKRMNAEPQARSTRHW